MFLYTGGDQGRGHCPDRDVGHLAPGCSSHHRVCLSLCVRENECVCACVSVSVSEREKERDGERERETDERTS